MSPVSAIRKKKHKKTQRQSDLRFESDSALLLLLSLSAAIHLLTCIYLYSYRECATGLISRPPLWSRLQSALPQRFNARSIALLLPRHHLPETGFPRCYSIVLWTNLIVSAARKSVPSPGTGSNPSSPLSVVDCPSV